MAAWTRTEETRAVGRRVRAERIQAGLSRTELAQLVGTSPDMVTQYEMGYKMSDLRLSKIAKTLGRSFDYMRTGEGMPYATEVLQPGSLAPEVAAPIASLVMAELEPAIRRVAREEATKVVRALRAEILQIMKVNMSERRPPSARTSRRVAAPQDAEASRGRGSPRTR